MDLGIQGKTALVTGAGSGYRKTLIGSGLGER